jgi:hypothetical protein
MRIGACKLETVGDIAIKGRTSRHMEREQTTLVELGFSDEEPIDRDILEVEVPCLRRSHAGNGEQSEQGAIGMRT